MAKLKNYRYAGPENRLIVKHEDVEVFANEQLREFKPDYFDECRRLDVDWFVEFYLGITPRFCMLGDNKTLGMTVLRSGVIICKDERGNDENLVFQRGDICIDEHSCKIRARSSGDADRVIRPTMLHECGHRQFDMETDPDALCGTGIYVKNTGIEEAEYSKPMALRFADSRAEHYAFSLITPREFVKTKFEDLTRKESVNLRKQLNEEEVRSLWAIIYKMADFFGITATAMAYRIKNVIPKARAAVDSILGKRETNKNDLNLDI